MAARDTAPRFIDEDESRPVEADEPVASGRANRWITWVLLGVLAIGIAVVAMSFFSASQSGDLNRDTAQVGTPGASSQTGSGAGSTGTTGDSSGHAPGSTGTTGQHGRRPGPGASRSNQTGAPGGTGEPPAPGAPTTGSGRIEPEPPGRAPTGGTTGGR